MTGVPHSGSCRPPHSSPGEGDPIQEQGERNALHEAQGPAGAADLRPASLWKAAESRARCPQGRWPHWNPALAGSCGRVGTCILPQESHLRDSQQPVPNSGRDPSHGRSREGPAASSRQRWPPGGMLSCQAGTSQQPGPAGLSGCGRRGSACRKVHKAFCVQGPAPKQREPIVSFRVDLFRREMQARRWAGG